MTNQAVYILDDEEQYAHLLTELATQAGWNAIAEYDPVNFLKSDLPGCFAKLEVAGK